MLKRLLAIILFFTWVVFLFLQRLDIYESLAAVYLLPVLILIVVGFILAEKNYDEFEDLHSEKQKQFFSGKVRHTEDDWRRWYEDIDEKHN